MLPGCSGLEVCDQLRSEQNPVPILMLTAMDTTEDTIKGLQAGADDYLAKPFDVDELLARIKALIRRKEWHESSTETAAPSMEQTLIVGPLMLDRKSFSVTLNRQVIELTAKEFILLELFMSTLGQVLTREQILDSVWGQTEDPLTNIVDVYIRRLRIKIDQKNSEMAHHAGTPAIATVRGVGYKLELL